MLDIDVRSRVPIYEQLMNQLKTMIIHEVIAADEQLPSVRNLAQELTINPNTIQKAYRELEREGYIYAMPGRGRFVSPHDHQDSEEQLRILSKEISKNIAEYLYLGGSKETIQEMLNQHEAEQEGSDTP